ncbi:MAG: hypothetical protein QM779_09655 [Propionicimonas sp.]|uniref:DUF7691 family protein n=1 Tax=Propionicimonas sp. TaxID=1955623 RepID=UPI003D0F5CBE
MGSVRLYAISIAEVRGIFGASDETSTALRAVAADRFGGSTPALPGLLGKLGPVLRRAPDAPVLRPDVPSGSDVDAVLSGRHVPPHRLDACWTLLEAWIDVLARDSIGRDCTEAQLNDFDFALARAEVPARYSLRSLLRTDLEITLLPAPGVVAGWASHEQALDLADAWRSALDRLDASTREVAGTILAWLDRFPGWAADARQQDRAAPDLVAVLRA